MTQNNNKIYHYPTFFKIVSSMISCHWQPIMSVQWPSQWPVQWTILHYTKKATSCIKLTKRWYTFTHYGKRFFFKHTSHHKYLSLIPRAIIWHRPCHTKKVHESRKAEALQVKPVLPSCWVLPHLRHAALTTSLGWRWWKYSFKENQPVSWLNSYENNDWRRPTTRKI